MKTYRDPKHGFAMDVPEEWSVPVEGEQGDFTCRPDEAVILNFAPMPPDIALDFIECSFAEYAKGRGYTNLQFGRITVEGKEHIWARYHSGHEERGKMYMLVFGGIGFAFTLSAANRTTFMERESLWDEMVRSFHLIRMEVQDDLDGRGAREAAAEWAYQRAYQAVEGRRFSEARSLLEECLNDNPRHILAHKEMAVVLEILGDLRGAIHHRREVERLAPSDPVNRYKLANLLAQTQVSGEPSKEAGEGRAMGSEDQRGETLKAGLGGKPLTYPRHYREEAAQQPGEKRCLKLVQSTVLEAKYFTSLVLVYQWAENTPEHEASRLARRAIAYIACAIYDAAVGARLSCIPSAVPNGRRPAWILEGEMSAVSLTLSEIDELGGTCQMTIGPVVTAIRRPSNGATHWHKLHESFKNSFGEIRV